MKARGAAVQGGLAAVALVAAYATWQREPDRPEGEVVALQAQLSDLAKVRYDDGVHWAELERRGGDTWLRYGARAQTVRAPAPDAGVPPAADSTIPAFEREVRGNELASQLLEKFAPLRANRALGPLAKEKLAELGLDGTTRRLEVTAGGATRGYKLSATSALLAAPYLLDESDGRVYLVSAALSSDFDSAAVRLVDKRLHAFPQKDYDAAVLKVGSKERAFVQTGEPAALKVAPRATPDKPDELAQNWLHRVWYLVPTEVLGKDEAPQGGAVELQARVDYAKAGKPLGFVELGRGPQDRLYARTEHTAGWVKAQLGAPEVMADAKRLAGE